ncbi:hypothetical protein [Campylobacter sp. LR196d]|nr:hypothetical protein [Campylobacter sp. LR196d]
MIKHGIFRQQLDFMVSKGATIRYAKTLFLDCKISFPNHNADQTITFIETITKSIIKKRKVNQGTTQTNLKLIKNELLNNQKEHKFIYQEPTTKDLQTSGRFRYWSLF